MQDTIEAVATLRVRFDTLKSGINHDKVKTRIHELESKTTDPSLWDNQNVARDLLQELLISLNHLLTERHLS